MHLLVFAAFFTPHRNGISAYIRTYAAALKKHGVKTSVVTYDLGGLSRKDTVDDIEVYRLPSRTLLGGTQVVGKRNAAYKTLMSEIEALDIDAVMTHTRFFPITQLGTRHARREHVPLVHVEHGNQHIPHPNPIVRIGAWLYDHTLGRWTMRNADAVIAISKPGVAFCKHLGADSGTMHHIPNTIRMRKAAKSEVRKKLGLSSRDTVVLFVGRLIQPKGVQDLIAALTGIDAHLVIVGEGPYKEALKEQAMEQGVSLHLVGEVPPEEIAGYLSSADLFVNPSHAEGLPTTVLEAASLGVPTIATNVGGTSQILPPECLVEPRDPWALQERIKDFLEEPSIWKKRSKSIREDIRDRFDVDTLAKRMKGLLEHVIKAKN